MKKTNFYCFLPSYEDYSGHENSYLEVFNLFQKTKHYTIKMHVADNNSINCKLKLNRTFKNNKTNLFSKIINIYKNRNIINKINEETKKNGIVYIDGFSNYFLISLIISKINKNNYTKLILFCRYNYSFLRNTISFFIIFLLLKKFKKSSLLVDTKTNFKRYKDFFKSTNIAIFPTPFFSENQKIEEKKYIKNKLNILCPGQFRKEKFGTNLDYFLKFNKNNDFILNISEKYQSSNYGKFKLKKFKENLNKKSYLYNLSNTNVIILPYDEQEYKSRTSGVFFEAINYTKIVFVTRNTWVANELKKNDLSELIIKDWRKFDINKILTNLNFTKVNLKLKKMKKKYLNFHSSENFIKLLNKVCDK